MHIVVESGLFLLWLRLKTPTLLLSSKRQFQVNGVPSYGSEVYLVVSG